MDGRVKGAFGALTRFIFGLMLGFGAGGGLRATAATSDSSLSPPDGTIARRGYTLFLNNCAHCHGADARGDEGPDLHGLTKPNERIASLIKNGIKGEMPKFGAKLNDADIRALITFLRTLKQ
jgi:mono/diheme cytochrome c family protein